MTTANHPSDKDFVEHWRRLGPLLESIRRAELRRFNYEEQLPLIDALLQLGVDHAVPRPTSGLVELERLLAKLNEVKGDDESLQRLQAIRREADEKPS
jgi:hypothetical protein